MISRFRVILISLIFGTICLDVRAQTTVNVAKHHNHDSRDGLFLEPAITKTAAAALTRDLAFDGRIVGNVYAQPLYIENGPGGKAMVIAVTESDNVYALDAAAGSIIWQTHVGTPVPVASLPCGDIDPLGITGTPVVDLPSRTLFLDAMTTPDNGATKKHLIYALNVDTGTINSGWPVDVNDSARFGTTVFTSVSQNQRGALAVVGGTLYVSYGGHAGDCGTYFGWVVGVPLNNPSAVLAWATAASGGGVWGVSGVSSDGTNAFIATGNTFGASVWSGGEAVIRFQPGPVFSGLANDYWAPVNWMALDSSDTDLGGSGAMLVDVPGATPSKLAVALGKDGNAYLLDRTTLGGVSAPVASKQVSSSYIIQAAATYRTAQGTYVVFRDTSSLVTAFRITATAPPTIATGWTAAQNGRGSPFVTSTDGTNNIIVWAVGAEGSQRLEGFDGDTGAVVFSGGGSNELMAGTRRFNTGIAARGRIYVANDNQVYAFTVPGGGLTITLQPVSQTVGAGDTVAFNVTATGAAPLSYRWMQNQAPLGNGGDVSGALTATLTLTSVTQTNAGNCTVIITNAGGSVTSSIASLTVVMRPNMALPTRLPDGSVRLSLTATPGLTYRLDASTNLVDWAALTNIANPSGTIQFIDLEATNSSQRFYRAVWVP